MTISTLSENCFGVARPAIVRCPRAVGLLDTLLSPVVEALRAFRARETVVEYNAPGLI